MHQARLPVRWSSSHIKGELHPATETSFVRRTSAFVDSRVKCELHPTKETHCEADFGIVCACFLVYGQQQLGIPLCFVFWCGKFQINSGEGAP